jgi:hypothetical protein
LAPRVLLSADAYTPAHPRVVLFCGCATLRDVWYRKEAPNGLQQQITPLASKEITNELGLIRRDFIPESETSFPKGLPGSDVENNFELRFASLEKGRICFSSTMYQGDNSEPREHLDTFRAPPFVVESFPTLRQLAQPRPIYVPASGKLLEDVSQVKDEVVTYQVRDPDRPGKFTDTKRRKWEFRLCGTAPDVTRKRDTSPSRAPSPSITAHRSTSGTCAVTTVRRRSSSGASPGATKESDSDRSKLAVR